MEPAIVLPRHQEQLPVQAEPAQMISIDAMQAATSAFDRLSDQMFKRTSGGEQVLEDSARDMIRPMLKKWLDDNLPSLVERLVRDEIERVARKGGR